MIMKARIINLMLILTLRRKIKKKIEDILPDISPFPRASFSQTKVIAQKAVIITSNHHFQELQHAKSKKQNSPKVMLKKTKSTK